jgi:hypothetical protein
MPKSLHDLSEYALGEDDLRKLLGNVPIYRYPELEKLSSPEEMFKGHDAVIILFLTEDQDTGHWLAVLNYPDHYEVFDSFGVAIDGNRTWLSKAELLEFNETAPLLQQLLSKGNKPVTHNTTKLQQDDSDTCGRWVAARILNRAMPLPQFVSMMKGGAGKPDDTVTRMIYSLLGK